MLCIVDGVPKILNLKEVITEYIKFQEEVVTRRVRFDLEKALAEIHILEGYKIAIDNIDEVIALIKKSASIPDAKEKLIERFGLSDAQAQAIVEMTLGKLSGLERSKVEDRIARLTALIADLRDILANEERIKGIIKEDLLRIKEKFGDDIRKFYTGVSYRHCLIWKNGNDTYPFMRPHDILGKRIGEYLPKEENGGGEFYRLMRESFEILNHHPVNEARRARGLKPANSAWLWSPGKKPALPNFREQWGLNGAVISAVDLIKGIGLCAGMNSIDVDGATGNVHTNYQGKAQAAINAFRDGFDYVYVHVEAPDECGHRAELENKVLSIGLISEKILKPVTDYLAESGEPYAVMLLPDHPTPICRRTHTLDPVPYLIWRSDRRETGVDVFCEKTASAKGNYLANGYHLMEKLTRG
jgi:2,3-diphosphopglycerate-independent phosphoglycerate mutase